MQPQAKNDLKQVKLRIVFDHLPPDEHAASPDKIHEWIRREPSTFLTYVNDEGNEEEGAIVCHDGLCYVGYAPDPKYMEDFRNWHALDGCAIDGEDIFLVLGKKVLETHLLKQLNVASTCLPKKRHRL